MSVLELDCAISAPISLRVKFTARAGVTALFGPSGVGKTLTLRLVAGLVRPSRGFVRFGGAAFDDAERTFVRPQARGVGYVPQHASLFPHLTVKENALLGAGPGAASLLAAAADALDLGPLLARRTARLSGGERQRAALARALVREPRLVLLDEPLSAVDLPLRERIEAWLLERLAASGAVALLVTHDPAEARALASRVVLFHPGLADGDADPSVLDPLLVRRLGPRAVT